MGYNIVHIYMYRHSYFMYLHNIGIIFGGAGAGVGVYVVFTRTCAREIAETVRVCCFLFGGLFDTENEEAVYTYTMYSIPPVVCMEQKCIVSETIFRNVDRIINDYCKETTIKTNGNRCTIRGGSIFFSGFRPTIEYIHLHVSIR